MTQSRAGVVVIAASNRPDLIDPALLRPGRFDRLLHVPRPDAAGRAAVLAVLTRRTPLAAGVDLQVRHASGIASANAKTWFDMPTSWMSPSTLVS